MSWDDDLKAMAQQVTGHIQAREAPKADYGGYLPGLIDSTMSAVGEFVGAKPTPEADAFRQDNPIGGFVSQALPGLGAYGAAFKLSKLPAAAKLLQAGTEGTLARFGVAAADSPVLSGITREVLRYAPLEASRLAIGAGVVDNSDQYGDLLSDVAVSTAFNGGLGTIAGLLDRAGPAAKRAGRVAQADFEAAPFAEYRAGLREGATTTGDFDLQTRMGQLRDQIDQGDLPGVKIGDAEEKSLARRTGSAYGRDYENAVDPADSSRIGSLFTLSRNEAREGSLVKKVLAEGPETSARTLNFGEKNEVLGGLGMDQDTFYSNVRNPRIIDVGTERGAASLRGVVGSPAFTEAQPGVWMAKENGGLYTVVKRLKAGEPSTPDSMKMLMVHGGSDFAAADAKFLGTGEPGGIRPLGKGLYGVALDPSDPTAAKKAIETAQHYANKYGKGNKTVHVFETTLQKGEIGSNGPHPFPEMLSDQQVASAKAYADADALPRGPERTAAYDRLQTLPKDAPPVARFERLPGDGQLEVAVHDLSRLKPVAKFSADTPSEAILKSLQAPKEPKPGTKAAAKAYIKRNVNAGDRYFVTRTDNPGLFAPETQKLGNAVIEDWARFREPYRPQGSDAFNANANLINNAITHQDYAALVGTGKKAWTGKVIASLGSKIAGATGLRDSEAVRRVVDNIYDTFKPTLELEKQDTMFGRLFGHLKSGQGLAKELVNRAMTEIDPILSSLSPEESELVYKASITQTPAEDIPKLLASENPSPRAVEAIQKLQEINARVIAENVMPAFQSAKMMSEFKPLEGYVMPRMYKGSLRALVRDEKGRPAFLASGDSHNAVRKEAQAVIDEAAANGKTFKMEDPHHVVETPTDHLQRITGYVSGELAKGGDNADIVRSAMKRLDVAKFDNGRMSLNKKPPNSFKERTGMVGTPDVVSPDKTTARAMSDAIRGNLQQLHNYAGYLTWKERFATEALSLSGRNPVLYDSLMRKANQFMGIEGQITNVLNKTLQPVLGPLLGSKPATKLAQVTNSVMYDWNLGFVNPTFALLNYLSPLQTVAPWISMMGSASSERIAQTMQFVHGVDEAGKVVGGMGVLSPIKIMAQSIKEMRNPDELRAAAIGRAKLDGTVHAQLFEGHESVAAQTLKESYAKGGWLGFTKYASRFLGVHSEQFSRSVAFHTAYSVGRDHFGLEGDQLYRFAKRGTETTMYQYATTDRARIITGPVGSVFGLFKNWQMHFIGSMAEYAGLALNEGVWGPLLWQSASALALGGLGATPLKMMADGLAKNYSDDPTGLAWLHHKFNPTAADAIYFGLPSFLGVSLQSSAMMPGTDTQNDLSSLTTAVAWERAKSIGQAMQKAHAVEAATGQSGYRDPAARDAMLQAISPRFLFRAVASVEGDAIKSMRTGVPIVQNASFRDKFLYGAGFNTTQIDTQYAVGKALRDRDDAKLTLAKGYGRAFADAQSAGDRDEMTRLLKRASADGVGTDSVVRSATMLRKRESGDYLSKWKAQDVEKYGGTIEGE